MGLGLGLGLGIRVRVSIRRLLRPPRARHHGALCPLDITPRARATRAGSAVAARAWRRLGRVRVGVGVRVRVRVRVGVGARVGV